MAQRAILTVCLSLILTYPGQVFSQSRDKADQLFPKNYASDPLSSGSTSTEKTDPQPTVEEQTATDTSDIGAPANDINKRIEAARKGQNVRSGGLDSKMAGKKVLNIELLVNAIDNEHFTKIYNQFVDVVRTRNLNVSNIYVLGTNPKLDLNTTFLNIMPYGAIINLDGSYPSEYANVTTSPAYLITTSDGNYLLEGIERLDLYINQTGEFIEQPVVAPAVKELPPKPDGGEF